MTPVAGMSIFPHSYAGTLRYDPFQDFAPVAHLSSFQLGLGVGANVPAKTLAEYSEAGVPPIPPDAAVSLVFDRKTMALP
jgi:tripartite-type tricarboxylate transporter receptor subunit TctC